MPKYRVIAILDASKFIDDIEAESAAEAEDKAWDYETTNTPLLCAHCANEVIIGGINYFYIKEVAD